MSPVERQAIEWECARLIALYANLNDAHRWEDVVALYHPDGMMTRPTAPRTSFNFLALCAMWVIFFVRMLNSA